MRMRIHIEGSLALVFALGLPASNQVLAQSGDLPDSIKVILKDKCVECHDPQTKSGGMDLVGLMARFGAAENLDLWVKIETAIVEGRMPPPDESRLSAQRVRVFEDWFESEFVIPGGVQHAGPGHPRRLTREELQNTLEDILHVSIRETVTNSRLHVIPDTIVEKFFSAGVRGESGFSNDAVTLSQESVDIQTCARCFSAVLSLVDSDESARKYLFGTATLPETISESEAREIISRFARSAWRREMTATEVDAIKRVYDRMAATKPASDAIKSSFLAILLSPPFLYRFEEPMDGQTPVVGDELAVRLAYFLWSAPPDQILLDLAAKGTLRETEVLKEQVRRMLADPRRVALAENLGGDWFDYKQLRQQSAVNKRSDKMAGFYRTQYEEALLFFDSLIRYDQPLFSIVEADWAFMNRHQAGIYRLTTQGPAISTKNELPPINIHYRDASRKIKQGNYEYKHAPLTLVKLSDRSRGGFVTIGPTMSVTSTPNRTSPIRRGVWVMERILGEKFEVPENVPDLEATQQKARSQRLNLSHNEILKLHSSQKGCVRCHQFIDPIGFGLEVFDQLGISRSVSGSDPAGEKLKWTPDLTPGAYADRVWPLTEPLVTGAECRVYFQYTKGRHRLNIKHVRLESGNSRLVDEHVGYTGSAQSNNVWRFDVPKDAPKDGWRLIAEVQGDGGRDSHGTITVSGPEDTRPGHKLPNGNSFASPAELKTLLLTDYRDQIIDNVTKRVLAYALGRESLPVDRPAIKKIKESIKENDYRMTSLIEAVVLSHPFRHKEN